MNEGWKEVKLGEVVETISKTYNLKKSEVVLINTSDVFAGKVLNHKYVDNKNLRGQFKKSFQKDDILYSEIRPKNKRFAYVDFNAENYIASTKLMVLRKKEDKITTQYLYKYLSNSETISKLQNIAENRSGTFPQITFTELKNLKLTLPPLPTQKKIADILTSFDDKIELLTAQNQTLEKTAQTIFKHWFVDFEFDDENGKPYKSSGGKMVESKLGMIPEGWRVGKLGEVGDIICGKTPKKSNKEFYDGAIPFIKIPDMHSNIFILKTNDKLTELGKKSQKNKNIPIGSLIVSCIATVGLVSITTELSQTNQQINAIVPKNIDVNYLYFYLLNINKYLIDLGRGGSATLNVNTSVFSGIKIILPIIKLSNNFSKIAKPVFTAIFSNQKEIETLKNTRDTLLPKLMSGEVKV